MKKKTKRVIIAILALPASILMLLFFKRKSPKTLTPETDLELLNRKVCPDCGTTEWTECNDTDIRHIECIGCGNAFNVMPCTPPYLFAYHIGYNRQGKRIQSERG